VAATVRRTREARFTSPKPSASFAFKAQPSSNEPLVREWWRGEYLQKRENLLLVGPPGTGETHLACALGWAAGCQASGHCRRIKECPPARRGFSLPLNLVATDVSPRHSRRAIGADSRRWLRFGGSQRETGLGEFSPVGPLPFS